MNITSPGFSVATTNAIHQQCQSEAIANNTTVSGGMEGIHVTTDPVGALRDYGQCVADRTQLSKQAQEKPQATTPSIGTESEKPNQGIGTTVNDILDGSKPKEEAKPQTDKEKCEANGGEYHHVYDIPLDISGPSSDSSPFQKWEGYCKS